MVGILMNGLFSQGWSFADRHYLQASNNSLSRQTSGLAKAAINIGNFCGDTAGQV